MQISRRWPIELDRNVVNRMGQDMPTALLLPPFPVPQGMPPEMAALLPNCGYNDLLVQCLNVRPSWSRTADIAAIFAADPFLRINHLADSLTERGIHRVTNLPTCSQLGPRFAAMVDQVELGFHHELLKLDGITQFGFEIYPAVTTIEQAHEALVLKPAGLIAVSRLHDGTDENLAPTGLNTLCERILDETDPAERPLLIALTGERLNKLAGRADGTIRYGA